MQSAVPKFASFRPKAVEPAEEATRPHTSDEDRPSKNKHKHKHTQRTRRHPEGHTSDHELKPTENHSEQRRPISPDRSADGQSSFVVDRRGDSGNLSYGANSKSQVPDYRPPHIWRTLGDGRARRPDAFSSKSVLSNLSRDARLALRGQSEYLTAGGAPTHDEHRVPPQDYLPLGLERKHKRQRQKSQGPAVPESPRGTPLGDGLSSESGYSDSENSSRDAEPQVEDPGHNLRQESAALLNSVRADPSNVDSWLRYIEFQGRWARQNAADDGSDSTAAEERGVAEVRISLYEDALEKIGKDHQDRSLLILGMLKEGEKAWPQAKFFSKWQEIATSNLNCFDVQLEFLNFMQTNFSLFSYVRCRDQHARYLSLLQQSATLSAPDSASRQVYALLRLASFMRDADFTELATCLWQALLELSCLTPDSTVKEDTNVFTTFGEYWDNENPRIGEEGSLGWSHSGTKPARNPDNPGGEESPGQSPSSDPITAWLIKEQDSRSKSTMPGRAADESSQEGDPYHIVFFADIEQFLVIFPLDYLQLLINAFLCYHQLPSLPDTLDSTSRFWWQDGFIKHIDLGQLSATAQIEIQNTITTTDTLFGTYQAIFASNIARDATVSQLGTAKFVCNALHALCIAMPENTSLAEYYLAFDLLVSPKRARKTAKAMLKENSSNLSLYNAYGLLESRLGNDEAANHVFSTAISLAASLNASERIKVVVLQRSWVWEALRLDNLPLARQRLLTIGETAAAIDASLSQTRTAALEQSLPTIAALASELLALHCYISSPSNPANLPSAIAIFSNESALLATAGRGASYAVELLHQAQAQLIQQHLQSRKPYPPRLVRDTLRPSIASFPTNTAFLALYAANERRFRLDDRVRQVAHDVLLRAGTGHTDESSIVPWFFALKAEMERNALSASSSAGATAHSVRATFEKAVSSRVGRHCAALWAAYLLWEVEIAPRPVGEHEATRDRHERRGKTEPQRGLEAAKKVWFRGVNALPWVKGFSVMGMALLRGCVTARECRDFVALMGEKGLRIHHELDDTAVD